MGEPLSVFAVVISDKEPGCLAEGCGFSELLSRPLICWRSRYSVVHYTPRAEFDDIVFVEVKLRSPVDESNSLAS